MNFKNSIHIFLVSAILSVIFWNCKKESATNDPTNPSTTITDIDGNVYHTVTIGTQVWMVENLKTTKYRNGDPIPNVTAGASWVALTTGAYCWYNNDVATYKANYGALYNWYAVGDSRNIAPAGWHVPTDAEWTILTDYLGGTFISGGKLKESGILRWATPNTGATNETNFTALPGGRRLNSDGIFYGAGGYSYWWSSSENDASRVWHRILYYYGADTNRGHDLKQNGYSVRCVKN